MLAAAFPDSLRFTGSFRLRSAGFRHYRSLWPLKRPLDGRRKGCTGQARLVTPRVLESEDEPALTQGPLCDLGSALNEMGSAF